MSRTTVICLVIGAMPAVAWGATTTTLLDENFESGLGGWTAKVYMPTGAFAPLPLVFDASGLAPDGTPIYGTNTGFPGSHAGGFSLNLSVDPAGDSSPLWIEKKWPALVAAGTYDISLDADFYVYYGGAATEQWALGNRMYLLTDAQYANPLFNNDSDTPAPGFKKDYWSGDSAGADNGVWQHLSVTQSVTTTTGNVLLRLLMYAKRSGPQSVLWDNVHLTLKQGSTTVFTFGEDFEAGLGNWTAMNWAQVHSHNDTPRTFGPTDALLYTNTGNPGSISAGFSSNMSVFDGTRAEWLQRQLTVFPGTYNLHLEFDRYVYQGSNPNNDTPFLFDSTGHAPDGTAIQGPNTGYSGSHAAGFSSNLAVHDGSAAEWIQHQAPTAVPPGTYSVTLELDVYVYAQDTSDQYGCGNRVYVLTDGEYNNPTWNFDTSAVPTYDIRKSFWDAYPNTSLNGMWQHYVNTYAGITTTTGNVEIRLLQHDKHAGAQAVAWDNVQVTFKQGSTTVFSFSDDFESGMSNWTPVVKPDDLPESHGYPKGVGNRVCVLTDSLFGNPAWDWTSDPGTAGFRASYWPGDPDIGTPTAPNPQWSYVGIWHHEAMDFPLTTTTGKFEIRLLQDDNNAEAQAVAWDNVKLTYTTPCNAPRFDADGDGDVDMRDFALMQLCYTGGVGAGPFPSDCRCFNADGNTAIDQADMAGFITCASGTAVPADKNCDGSFPPP